MKRTSDADQRVLDVRRQIQRAWFMGGIVPLAVSAMLMLAVSAVWASPTSADEHTVERGFQAVLAVCAGLFLIGFWLDGRWTDSARIASRIRHAAGGDEFTPSRSQLAAQADVALKTVTSSVNALTAIGAAIAAAAVISVWAGLGVGDGVQLILLGLCYQLFVISRHPYYEELVTAAVQGELVTPEADDHNDTK